MPGWLVFLTVVLALIALDLAALRWGADSRDGYGGLEQGRWPRRPQRRA